MCACLRCDVVRRRCCCCCCCIERAPCLRQLLFSRCEYCDSATYRSCQARQLATELSSGASRRPIPLGAINAKPEISLLTLNSIAKRERSRGHVDGRQRHSAAQASRSFSMTSTVTNRSGASLLCEYRLTVRSQRRKITAPIYGNAVLSGSALHKVAVLMGRWS